MQLFLQPRSLKLTGGVNREPNATPVSKIHDKLAPEHYSLVIAENGIELHAGGKAGLAYGLDTFRQIREQTGGELPCLVIEDGPAFRERGYMLDISRCKVPTMESLRQLVDLLAGLRYNQLQLYTEHTFAYAGHETVWRESSPITGEEIEELDAYCAARHIELVPNQNSFGHMERWLRHPPYRHLAECPDGFTSPFGDFRPFGATLKPNADSLAFIDELYGQLLPHFSSRKFNVGCDETFDLGLGWSRERAQTEGTEEIYLEFLEQVGRLVHKHGREMRFWADIVLKRPELIERLPAGTMPIIWGYERDHPFAEQCAQVASAGLAFQIAPGDSTWLSPHGRLETARANIAMAAREGLRHGAQGLLLTHWGDQGHLQPWPLALPALVLAALHSWEGERTDPDRWPTVLNERIVNDPTGHFAQALAALGEIETCTAHRMHNRSVLFDALFGQAEKLSGLAKKVTPTELAKIEELLEQASAHLAAAQPRCADADWLRDEVQQAIDLSALGLARLRLCQNSQNCESLRPRIEAVAQAHKTQWLRRNRPGGLPESLRYLAGLHPPPPRQTFGV